MRYECGIRCSFSVCAFSCFVADTSILNYANWQVYFWRLVCFVRHEITSHQHFIHFVFLLRDKLLNIPFSREFIDFSTIRKGHERVKFGNTMVNYVWMIFKLAQVAKKTHMKAVKDSHEFHVMKAVGWIMWYSSELYK